MKFHPTAIAGVTAIELEPHADERGMFARAWCEREFGAAALASRMVQANVSRNFRRGTIRGMHFQWPPSREGKLVRCTRGRIFDVALDLRPLSPTFMQHVALELDAESGRALYIAPGLAHGFQTLEEDSELFYLMSDFYVPELQSGVRWNDATLGIAWPLSEVTLLPRDAAYPDFDPVSFAREHARREAVRSREQ